MTNIHEYLRTLETDRFFGSVELKFEAGKLLLIRKTETIKPDYRDNRGDESERCSRP